MKIRHAAAAGGAVVNLAPPRAGLGSARLHELFEAFQVAFAVVNAVERDDARVVGATGGVPGGEG